MTCQHTTFNYRCTVNKAGPDLAVVELWVECAGCGVALDFGATGRMDGLILLSASIPPAPAVPGPVPAAMIAQDVPGTTGVAP